MGPVPRSEASSAGRVSLEAAGPAGLLRRKAAASPREPRFTQTPELRRPPPVLRRAPQTGLPSPPSTTPRRSRLSRPPAGAPTAGRGPGRSVRSSVLPPRAQLRDELVPPSAPASSGILPSPAHIPESGLHPRGTGAPALTPCYWLYEPGCPRGLSRPHSACSPLSSAHGLILLPGPPPVPRAPARAGSPAPRARSSHLPASWSPAGPAPPPRPPPRPRVLTASAPTTSPPPPASSEPLRAVCHPTGLVGAPGGPDRPHAPSLRLARGTWSVKMWPRAPSWPRGTAVPTARVWARGHQHRAGAQGGVLYAGEAVGSRGVRPGRFQGRVCERR